MNYVSSTMRHVSEGKILYLFMSMYNFKAAAVEYVDQWNIIRKTAQNRERNPKVCSQEFKIHFKVNIKYVLGICSLFHNNLFLYCFLPYSNVCMFCQFGYIYFFLCLIIFLLCDKFNLVHCIN